MPVLLSIMYDYYWYSIHPATNVSKIQLNVQFSKIIIFSCVYNFTAILTFFFNHYILVVLIIVSISYCTYCVYTWIKMYRTFIPLNYVIGAKHRKNLSKQHSKFRKMCYDLWNQQKCGSRLMNLGSNRKYILIKKVREVSCASCPNQWRNSGKIWGLDPLSAIFIT